MDAFPDLDWSTAIVSATSRDIDRHGYELRVDLSGSVQADWRDTFNELARQRSDQTVDWQEAQLSGNTIVVSGLQPIAREAVKTWLAELVPLTGETVLRRREKVAEAVTRAEEEERAEDEAAETLTEWFRSDA